ncbi:MAG TPA: DUF4249 domain-containing protein [Chryseolinea sp.]|nr:DUF4249 domain-containing protein [Chryseolinea sp.]
MRERNKLIKLLNTGLIIAVTACVEPYYAPHVAGDLSILVVDGFVNASDGSITVRLSHTAKLTNEAGFPAEKDAVVSVKSDAGDYFNLVEQDSGRYGADGLTIDPLLKYQLYINTSGGEEYISDFISITETPPIDTLSWRQRKDGLDILASTHDVAGNSRYYRWDYVETWEYHAPYLSGYKAENSTAIYRQPDEFIFVCYETFTSTEILVGSTERLGEDVINEFPLVYIPRESSKISVLYHINVQQRVMDKKEYEFWKDLERVTETLGGLFDSQPYEIVGNIYNISDPGAPVLGYFSGGRVTHKEMFIYHNDLTEELQRRPFHGCSLDTVCVLITPGSMRPCNLDLTSVSIKTYLIGTLSESGIVWGFTASSEECADCRQQGGVLAKPDFWP